mmetsp:Transcript_49022/g.149257  ORF Transcript_49022/g.149257 Transcript_49022/m.149257 type:complete len:298 (-) Transcript_49022:119-1012(-)
MLAFIIFATPKPLAAARFASASKPRKDASARSTFSAASLAVRAASSATREDRVIFVPLINSASPFTTLAAPAVNSLALTASLDARRTTLAASTTSKAYCAAFAFAFRYSCAKLSACFARTEAYAASSDADDILPARSRELFVVFGGAIGVSSVMFAWGAGVVCNFPSLVRSRFGPSAVVEVPFASAGDSSKGASFRSRMRLVLNSCGWPSLTGSCVGPAEVVGVPLEGASVSSEGVSVPLLGVGGGAWLCASGSGVLLLAGVLAVLTLGSLMRLAFSSVSFMSNETPWVPSRANLGS